MKREFKFDSKESYTQAEVGAILDQHTTFVEGAFKGYVTPEDHKKTTDELQTYTAAKRDKHISTLATEKKLTDSDEKIRDAIALAKISDEDDDATVINKISGVIKERAHLQSKVESADEILLKSDGETKTPQPDPVDQKLKNL